MTAPTLPIKGQLEFDFDEPLGGLGSIWEAMELYEAVGGRYRGDNDGAPDGWEFLGAGGTRTAYLAPSGVCYKVCHEYDDEEETHNEVEYRNFKRIEREGKLPPKWRVPKSYLHIFEGNLHRWDYHMKQKRNKPVRVVILACEFIPGDTISYLAPADERHEVERAFRAVGLNDTGGANAVRRPDGTHYIIDAAEWMPPEG